MEIVPFLGTHALCHAWYFCHFLCSELWISLQRVSCLHPGNSKRALR